MFVPSSTILPRSNPISGEDDFEGAAEILRAWSEGLTPDPDLTVSQWADRHRMLSGRASAEPGRYRTARTPYMGEIMDRLSPGEPGRIGRFIADISPLTGGPIGPPVPVCKGTCT